MTDARARRVARWLGVIAFGLAVGAPLAGSPYTSRHAAVDVTALARTVAREEDHVTALELAQWIKDRRRGLRVLDVRTVDEYKAYHLPTAEHLALDSVASTPFRADETLVLYSEGGAHAAQAWVFLRALGYRHVFFLRGGLYEWLEQVLNPTLADTTPAARNEFARAAVLSRYFGGVPRSDIRSRPASDAIRVPTGDSTAQSAVPLPMSSSAARVQEIRRRGC